jgi:hypothetical protein
MQSIVRLRLEQLEDRCVPAKVGIPWPSSNITLSFAPDGTNVTGSQSNLMAMLSPLGTSAAELSILQAFQTWAVNSNINIGLVSDNGSAWDVPGLIQGDPRFGDIRIAGRTLAQDVTAITTPFNYFNTQSGNVQVNTAMPFSISGTAGAYDLFTSILHEAGLTFGVGESLDTTSAMYTNYQGIRTGLSSADIAALQALYGTRTAESNNNATMATAMSYTNTLTADLGSVNDTDYYSFTAGGSSATVQLQAAGLSLAETNVQVLDSFGNVVAQGAAASIFNNNVTLNLSNLVAGSSYYVQVSSETSDVFGVGSYQLSINGAASSQPPPPTPGYTTITPTTVSSGTIVAAGPTITTKAGATPTTSLSLTQTVSPSNPQQAYSYQVAPANSVTYFSIHTPVVPTGQSVNLIASVANLSGTGNFQIAVYDTFGNLINSQVLSQANGGETVEVQNITSDANYRIQVTANAKFNFAADYTAQDVPFTLGANGNVTTAAAQSGTLTVTQSQDLYLLLSTAAANGMSLDLTITDANGNAVFDKVVAAGTQQSITVFLQAGQYQVSVIAVADPAVLASAINYSLVAATITSPIGAVVDNTTSNTVNNPTNPPATGTPPQGDPNGVTASLTANNPNDGSMWY